MNMNALTREEEILLQEYREAGQACRNHDQLIRTGLTIFGAVQAAIIGFVVAKEGVETFEKVLVEVLGLWLSIVVLLTTRRLHYRYKTYMERAKAIERRLGMYLYQYSFDYFGANKISGPGNKKVWASLPVLAMIIYVLLLGRVAYDLLKTQIC